MKDDEILDYETSHIQDDDSDINTDDSDIATDDESGEENKC